MTELQSIRRKHKITISQLSKDLGYDKAYISKVERYKVPVSKKYIDRFMKYFGVEKDFSEYERFVQEQKELAVNDVERKFM